MAYIQTVLGQIAPEELGITNYHDHLMTIGGGEVRADKDLGLFNVDYAVDAMHKYKAVGGSALVDMNPIDCGRDSESLVRISRETGVHIIACTGWQRAVQYDSFHWIYKYEIDELAELIIAEITDGMDINNYASPVIKRGTARAGVIKVGTDYNCIRPMEYKAIEAGAIAHKATGAPISTHAERGTMAVETVRELTARGVAPEKIIIGHIDRNPDFEYHQRLAEMGVYLGYDGPSRIKYWPDSVLIELIKKMVEAGYSRQIMLGGDNGRASYWPQYGGGPGHNYIYDVFVPRLREAGIAEQAIEDILIRNPAGAFSIG